MQVDGKYENSAKRLDRSTTPAMMALSSLSSVGIQYYPPVRGLVVEAYGGTSSDVHALLKLARPL